MSLKIQFELGDDDLKHFREAMDKARKAATGKSAQDITDAANKLLEASQGVSVPNFVAERLHKLRTMISMVHDKGWGLPEDDKQHVLSALTYFAEPADVIADTVPVLGFLDDAIMIELVQRELKHEIEAYEDFCRYREAEATRRGEEASSVDRPEWAEARRQDLQSRMRRRRRGSGGGKGGRGSAFTFW